MDDYFSLALTTNNNHIYNEPTTTKENSMTMNKKKAQVKICLANRWIKITVYYFLFKAVLDYMLPTSISINIINIRFEILGRC